jgi:mycothiol synthase
VDSEYSISELTDDGVPAVIALCRRALDLPEDRAEAAEIVLRLRETTGTQGWSKAPRRITGFTAVNAGGELLGAVLGSVSHEDPSIGHIDLIAVDPEQRRRGVGRSLISRVEGALAGLGVDDLVMAGNPPYYAWPGIDVRYTAAICAAMALGYRQDDYGWNMTARTEQESTATAENELAGTGVSVRRAGPADLPALVEFSMANFAPLWAGEISHSVDRERAGCHIAADAAGRILGFAAYGSSRPSWFGPMGTAPAGRGLGIGSLLLRRCLADQRANGFEEVQIGWVGPLPFYSGQVSARVERVFVQCRREL